MLPPGQRLDTDDLSGREVDDRLVVHVEPVVLEGIAQVVAQHEPLRGPLGERDVEHLHAAASPRLRVVHRDVREAQQLTGRGRR